MESKPNTSEQVLVHCFNNIEKVATQRERASS